MFRLGQINTPLNRILLSLIESYLNSLGINSRLSVNGHMLELLVEGKHATTKLMDLFTTFSNYYFWKSPQITMFNNVLMFLNLNIRNWYELQVALVQNIFSIPNIRELSLPHWLDRLADIFNTRFTNTLSGHAFIAPYKGKLGQDKGRQIGWVVTLPKSLSITPKAKYFLASTHGSLDKALEAAVAYRDLTLNKWLKDHNL